MDPVSSGSGVSDCFQPSRSDRLSTYPFPSDANKDKIYGEQSLDTEYQETKDSDARDTTDNKGDPCYHPSYVFERFQAPVQGRVESPRQECTTP